MTRRDFFSERIQLLRAEQGCSLHDIAAYLGVTDEAVRLMMRGKRAPSFDVLCALADYFDVSIDYLVGRVDKR